MTEPCSGLCIVINGKSLTSAQAMIVRVALECFAAMLAEENALGSGDHAVELAERYRTLLAQVQMIMYDD